MARMNEFQVAEIGDVLDKNPGSDHFRMKITGEGGETKWLSISRDMVKDIRVLLAQGGLTG